MRRADGSAAPLPSPGTADGTGADGAGAGAVRAQPAGGGQLPRLTALRAFAALAVFTLHLDKWGVAALPDHLARAGYVGVAFFFVLSGFVLAWGTRPGLPARTFYRRRFARIWPSHLVMLVVAAVVPVVAVHRGAATALANALLVQAWLVDPRYVFGMDGVSWSLSIEAFFYLCFPLAVLLARRLAPSWRWGLVAVALTGELLGDLALPSGIFCFPLARLPEFLLGVVAGLSFREGWRPRVPVWAALAATALGLAAAEELPNPVGNVVVAVPFALALLSAASRDVAGRGGWLQHRWLVFAGEASFAFYLVHEVVIVNLRGVLPASALASVPAILVAAVLGAVALHLAVEKPCNRLLRGGAAQGRALAAPAVAVTPTSTVPAGQGRATSAAGAGRASR